LNPLLSIETNTHASNFLASLNDAHELEQGFFCLEQLVFNLGFDSLVYSAMPKSFGDPGLFTPVFLSSDEFGRGFLTHYNDASLWEHDFTIERIQNGYMQTMDWNIERKGALLSAAQNEVIDLAGADYGIKNAISIPMQSDRYIIAGASVTSRQARASFDALLNERLSVLKFALSCFHQFVFRHSSHSHYFYLPLLRQFTPSEKSMLAFATTGRPLKQSRDFTNLSPTRAGNVLSSLYEKLGVANRSELSFLIGRHRLLEML